MSNPYELQKAEPSAVVEIESSRAIAEVQGQVVMAKKFPRDPIKSMDRILNECRRATLAEQAEYSFPRGGTMVTGPSIRLAETIARNWGNLSFGTVEVDRRGDESSMLAYAWDLETNVMARQEFKVRHVRDTKDGAKACAMNAMFMRLLQIRDLGEFVPAFYGSYQETWLTLRLQNASERFRKVSAIYKTESLRCSRS